MNRFERNDGPPFSAPWQAEAFALAVQLNAAGVFSWQEWTEAFGERRAASAQAGIADRSDQYYLDWIDALERLLEAKGLTSPEQLAAVKQAWIDAYRRTPHGQAVRLAPSLELREPSAAT